MYDELLDKVDTFARDVAARRSDLTCHAGCNACCQVKLSVCDVEADALRAALATLGEDEKARLADNLASGGEACALLDADDRCLGYEGRPAVCRSQGLPLSYPRGTIPAESLTVRTETHVIAWCPLNFCDRGPESEDILDAERVDTMLALINRGHSETPLRRTAIDVIAQDLLEG